MKKFLILALCIFCCTTALAEDIGTAEQNTAETAEAAESLENTETIENSEQTVSDGAVGYVSVSSDAIVFQGKEVGLTLDQALEIMLKDNPTIKQMELVLEQAKISSESAEDIALKGMQAYWSRRRDSADYLKNVTQVEIMGKFGLESAERNCAMVENSLKADLTTAYFNLLNAYEAYDITLDSLNIANKAYETTKNKYELGMVSLYDIAKSEGACITAQNDVLAADNAIKAARMNLNIKLGLSVTANIALTDKLENREYEIKPISQAIELALENRNEIKAAEFNVKYQQVEMDIAKKKYGSNTHVLDYKTQEVNMSKAHFDLENAKKNIEMEVRMKSLAVSEARAKLELMKKNEELSDQELHLAEVSYDAGLITFQDLEKSILASKAAKLSLAKVKLDYNMAIMNFEDCMSVGRG